MEVCVDNIQSAINAADGGAARIELCSSLSEGGLTPSFGVFQTIKRLIEIPIFVMLRPRPGMDFVYSDDEIVAMECDARLFKSAGANGFVFGALTQSGCVDRKACARLLDAVRPLPATFHRAFDCVAQPVESLNTIVELGFCRILTSGQKRVAEDGSNLIRELIEEAAGRIIIVPGSGINEHNAGDVLRQTGAVELHGSVRVRVERCFNVNADVFADADQSNYTLLITDTNSVRKIVSILAEWNNLSKRTKDEA